MIISWTTYEEAVCQKSKESDRPLTFERPVEPEQRMVPYPTTLRFIRKRRFNAEIRQRLLHEMQHKK